MILEVVTWALVAVALVVADLRWLRVAQREHYAPARVTRMALLWMESRRENALLLLLALLLAVAGLFWPWASVPALLLVVVWPYGLGVRGSTSGLAWTARLKRLTAAVVVLEVAIVVLAWRAPVAVLVAVICPLLVDAALAALRPVESRLSRRFVERARERVGQVRPTLVGLTGSYGKTSTKLYIQQLLSGSMATIVSPASFNNLLGLSRAVNERLVPGTDVFVAEMGTYGPGELRELCRVFPPDIAVITTIGEAHLERMGSRAVIVAAKSEITEHAGTVVLNVDVPELRELADRLAGDRTVLRCSSDASGTAADVVVSVAADGRWYVRVDGAEVATVTGPPSGHAINLAVAIGVARALGIPADILAGRMVNLPGAPHRAETILGANGVWVVDNTYNSNPVGARAAFESARQRLKDGSRIYVITPGMVELGRAQCARNAEYARVVLAHADATLAIVGRTNRRCLLRGATDAAGTIALFPDRQAATDGLGAQFAEGDVVIYENDLPDHYP